MRHAKERLKALTVERLAKRPGLYADGGGLYLLVQSPTSRSWLFRFMLKRRAREMGLGSYPERTLAEARALAHAARRLLLDGIDPIEHRNSLRAQTALDAAKSITFRECAERYIEGHKAGWRNEKHREQWSATLDSYAYPALGGLSVQAIDTGLVMKVLEPIWKLKPETASRLRGRIEAVLDWARVRGYRDGENPARWRGHLDKMLPARAKLQRPEHHAALPYAEIAEFVSALQKQEGIAARALEFAILTAARTGEVIGAKWSEIDFEAPTWTVPGSRMKSGREHRVPLSDRAVEILEGMAHLRDSAAPDAFVYPGGRKGRPLSNMAMLQTLRRMGRSDLTVHGFRSTFRDWCAERTAFPSEVAEMALAHVVGNKVEAAYRRGDLFDRRRQLAEAWSRFCSMPASELRVVPLFGAVA